MPNTTLQSERELTVSYPEIAQMVKETAFDSNGVLFISCAGAPSYMETQVRGILESQPGLNYKMWSGKEPGSLFLLMPGQTLDAVHFQGLLLKQRLQEIIPDFDPRMTLASFSAHEELTEQVLNQMEDSVKNQISGEIHIFTSKEAHTTKSRILIVEGDATVREFLEIRLQMQGYETIVADNGLSALELIESWKPDLVLTELNLYGIDGLPYIHHIQQLQVPETPKIVVLTEQRVEQTISLCFQNGVDDYVTKPFSPVELDARIRRCIS
ncbi:response regulator transcription factor [Paenibacillus sp. DYY-L-2]|uniref:response regulator transcription factor n=1 Tax=Paenibacillus sp. DYY-L-2 TaxID=3447013 RepID=UPI003F502D75